MKPLKQFSLKEWLKLEPIAQAFKQLRNDLVLWRYLQLSADNESAFLEQQKALEGQKILLVIAFEQPLALHWLLAMCKRHVPDFTVLVCDNSLNPRARQSIQDVCVSHAAPYLSLPPNTTRHVNRSHGLAMTWVFHHVVRAIKPNIFGYIDHDMLPIADISLEQHLAEQDCYGLINPGHGCWNLWAGFCLYRYSRVVNIPMNYLYDFSRGLDTGGRNWAPLYASLDQSTLKFAPDQIAEVTNSYTHETRSVQMIDQSWLHIGGISYNNNFDEKEKFFIDYLQALGVESPLSLTSQARPD